MTEPNPSVAAFRALGQEQFLSLTTFRRDGTGVSTPVWVAADGDTLLVTTLPSTGKVKRLRNDARVELRPCSRSGKVADGAPTLAGRAEVLTDATAVAHVSDVLRSKYGLQFRLAMFAALVAGRGRPPLRVGLRIELR